MFMKKRLLNSIAVIGKAWHQLAINDPLRMAGATAFFTTFALPPVLMIIVRIFGLFIDKRVIGKRILDDLGKVIGTEGRMQVLHVIRSVLRYQLNWVATIAIFIFLLFVATTLFKVIRSSINQIWGVHVVANRSFMLALRSRLKSLCIILFTGVLFLPVMAVDVVSGYLSPYLQAISGHLDDYVHSWLSHIVSFVVVTAWFFTVFRFLPDARMKASITLTGAIVTGILFSIGKYILRWLLSGDIKGLYGASGATVLILLFVFYSSLILYFGASFTKTWMLWRGEQLQPVEHASTYHLAEDEDDVVERA
jgi:membrane protein